MTAASCLCQRVSMGGVGGMGSWRWLHGVSRSWPATSCAPIGSETLQASGCTAPGRALQGRLGGRKALGLWDSARAELSWLPGCGEGWSRWQLSEWEVLYLLVFIVGGEPGWRVHSVACNPALITSAASPMGSALGALCMSHDQLHSPARQQELSKRRAGLDWQGRLSQD